jgi:hypothetical protein
MDEDQDQAFRRALRKKQDDAREASKHPERNPRQEPGVTLDASGGAQPGIQTDDRGSQDVFSVRDKNSGHGKKTADKWNQ